MSKKGFTLVELMVVITVIGLIAVLSLPGYKRFMQNYNLNGDVQQLATVLRTARSTAVMKNENVVFSFDMDARTYQYFEDRNGNGARDNDEYQSSVFSMSQGIKIRAHTLPATTLTFGAKGTTRNSGTITLMNAYSKNKGIRIYGGTGNIQVD